MSRSLLLVTIAILGLTASGAGAEVPRSGGQLSPVVGASSAGEVVAVTDQGRLSARIAPPGGGFGPARRLTADGAYSPTVEVGPAGHAVAMWSEGGLQGRLLVAFRSPGGAFGAPEVLAADTPGGEQVAVAGFDAAGTATLAWAEEAGTALLVRTRDAAGTWSAPVRVPARDAFRPRLRVRADGGATLAWEGDGPRGNSSQVMVADRPPGGTFGEPRVLAGSRRDPGSVVLGGNDRGDVVVAWSQLQENRGDGAFFTIHAAFRPAGRDFSRPRRLTRRGEEAASPSVSVSPTGRMVLAFSDTRRRRLYARIRTASGTLQPVRTLSRDLEENSESVALAVEPGLVVWYDRDPGRSRLRTAYARLDGGFEAPQQRFVADYGDEGPSAFATDDGLLFVKPNGRILRTPR